MPRSAAPSWPQCGILSHHSHRGLLYRRTIVSRVIACIRECESDIRYEKAQHGTIRVPVRDKRVTGSFTGSLFEHSHIRKKKMESRAELAKWSTKMYIVCQTKQKRERKRVEDLRRNINDRREYYKNGSTVLRTRVITRKISESQG